MTSVDVLTTPVRWPHILLPATPATRGARAAVAARVPTDLDTALAAGAFGGLTRAVRELRAEGTIAAILKSGLRGRAGAGYPTGEKWRQCAAAPGERRYVVVNAYQADPAVMTERLLLETNPYAVLEGAAIAAFAVGASQILIALRVEASEAIAALTAAVEASRRAGYLGEDVLGSGRDIDVEIRPLAGSYMIGEETVLLRALEGKRGQPEQQPPYPTTRGLFGLPTLIHNPQTFAAVPAVLTGQRGAAGTVTGGDRIAQGTILVQLSGSVARPGIVEVPLGTPLRDIVELGGPMPAPYRLKALLVGGPTGGFLPPDCLNVDYEPAALARAGAHIGSGSIVVLDGRTCLVDLAAGLTRYCADEACGKTIPCRIGLRRLAEMGARIRDGLPRGDEIGRLTDLSADIVASGLCDHERRSTLPLMSLVRYFRAELDAHIVRSTCPAGVCRPAAAAPAKTAARGAR
jgi:NADH:ubiquinone oxidoreductase subunit F (NADH-binding)